MIPYSFSGRAFLALPSDTNHPLRSVLVYPRIEHNLTLLTWNKVAGGAWKKYTLALWSTPLLYGPFVVPVRPQASSPPGLMPFAPLTCLWSLSAQLHKGAHVLFKYMRAVTSLGPRFRKGREAEGRVNETWVTQLLSEAENSLWPKPWV